MATIIPSRPRLSSGRRVSSALPAPPPATFVGRLSRAVRAAQESRPTRPHAARLVCELLQGYNPGVGGDGCQQTRPNSRDFRPATTHGFRNSHEFRDSLVPDEPIISIDRVTKRFPGVTALADVSFDIRRGEVHAIVGENGAGKSTLMKIISGVIPEFEGELRLRGRPIRFTGTRDAERAGVSIIHQELNLVEQLSAAANIFLGRERRNRLRPARRPADGAFGRGTVGTA